MMNFNISSLSDVSQGKSAAEEHIGVVTVMDVGIDIIDQLLKTMRFLLR